MLTSSQSIQSTSTRGTWAKALAQPGVEFGPVSLPVISGAIPQGLCGSLYSISPARLERGGQKAGHWFDGDGAVLAVHFDENNPTGIYRYVKTEAYQAEEKAGKLFFGSYGRTPSGPIWKQLGLPMKNCANTALLALPDKLLALWEAGLPHALDLKTLETIGLDSLSGLEEDEPYAAHPKRDPETGDIYNFGVTYGRKAALNLYRSDYTGRIQQRSSIPLDGLPMIHNFVLVGQYLVFCISPVYLNALPFLMKQKSFSEALSWQPQKGTQILVIDRTTLSLVSRSSTEPWFQWRFGNSYIDADSNLVIDVIRYEDFQINQFLKEVASGVTKTIAPGRLWQLRLNPQTAKVLSMQPLLDRTCEFPTVAPSDRGQPCRYTYLCAHRSPDDMPSELFNSLIRFDYQTGQTIEAHLEESCYPSDPVYIPDQFNSGKGWVASVVFNGNRNTSEVWFFDAAQIENEPVCKLALPMAIPLNFHSVWQA